MKKFISGEGGVAAVEFALVAPVLLFLLVGTFDYGMLVFERMRMENLAHSATDYMVAGGNEADLADDLFANYFPDDEAEETISSIAIEAERFCECEDGSAISCETDICPGGEDDYKRQFQTVDVTRTYELLFSYPGLTREQVLTGRARIQIR